MTPLTENWFAEGNIDFEYKQYLLLAYLQEAQRQYAATKLYPTLADLIGHYHSLQAYQAGKRQLEARAPKKLLGIDSDTGTLAYAPTLAADPLLEEIDQIVAYSLPRVQAGVVQGTELYETVEQNLQLEPVGVLPLYKYEGYVLLRIAAQSDILVYQYRLSTLTEGSQRMRGLHTHYLTSYAYSLSSTYAHMKLELVRAHKALPNPATFVAECTLQVPLAETLWPVAKRRLLRTLVQAEG